MNDDFQIRKDIDNLIEKFDNLNYDRMTQEGMATEDYVNDIVDEKIKENIPEDNVSYSDLLERTEDYNQYSDKKYILFRGDCWTVNHNFESSVAITSTSETNFTVTGTFRTYQDLVGIYWNSQDSITHPYISYGSRYDYRDVIFECDVEYNGCLFDSASSTFTIEMMDGSIYYPKTADYMTYEQGRLPHLRIDFNNIIIAEGGEYIRNGKAVKVTNPIRLDVSNIKFIMFVLTPVGYDKPVFENGITHYIIKANNDFYLRFTNIQVSNGEIGYERATLNPHSYRICEGYDDFYDLNPYRICKEMRKLGYTEWCDLYIGASHFYEKSGVIGDSIEVTENPDEFGHTRTEKMVLDTTIPLNNAFSTWLDCYSRELKANDCPNLVISVSMENLQCPPSWRQKQCFTTQENPNGYALTGWTPSTFFYSPCHPDVLPYMQSVSKACLEIVTDNGLPPILQMGEAWWWWNENYKPNGDTSHYQPPCFYDDSTKQAYQTEFGTAIPEYTSAWQVGYNTQMMEWLNQKLCNYSDGLRDVVKSYYPNDGLYMALFFPPSVLDDDRVPSMMHEANYITNAYHPSKLDVLQIEDYDWVTGLPQSLETMERDRSHHPLAYTIGQQLGFPEHRLHYFGGFVQYPENAIEFWRLIKKAMDDAINLNFKEVFVWAGSQVRRDHKMLGYEDFELIQYLLSGNQNAVVTGTGNEDATDTGNLPEGWQIFSKTTGNTEWWNVTDATKLKYRKDKNVVRIEGDIYLYSNSDNLTELLVCRLPAGFRPSHDLYFSLEGTHNSNPVSWLCCVRTNGEIYVMNVVEGNTLITPAHGDIYDFETNKICFMI